ncbi:NADP-dependent oxidoreductase [Streptomyces sp. NBC_01264]|uniref:NADP-dependent oxidoreductase n=1 Tax=Streptomyces sp. NBC_01264 TaxID=2903804 RepID=UPI002254B00C|nr:NADP-dependent oxidoreductase [Streptomyces sp. NBC_01264]MCX4781659.1 NADP-dependent oxidoreductase [Streptomyces sp. NBC_01264]
MRAVVSKSHGKIEEVVGLATVDEPPLRPSDLRVEMRAASVNPIDWLIVAGALRVLPDEAFPLRLGSDGAGVVTAVGADVTGFSVGDQVFFRVAPDRTGTFATVAVVDAALAARMPASVSFAEAAGIPLVALTAWQGLVEQARVEAGQRLLVHGGAGAVGAAVVQIARHLGLHVTATAGAEDADWVRDLGAEQVIDYRTQSFEDAAEAYDVVFDTVGGQTQDRSLSVLRRGGTLVSVLGVPDAEQKAKLHDVTVRPFFMRPDGAQLARIAALVDTGGLRSRTDRVFPLEDAPQALIRSASGHAKGKVIISMGG